MRQQARHPAFLTPLHEAALRGELLDVHSDVLAALVACRSHLDVLELGIRLGLDAHAHDSTPHAVAAVIRAHPPEAS